MSTWGELKERVLLELGGYTEDQESISTLAADLASDATSATVTDGTGFSQGIAEIGEELVWVSSVQGNQLAGLIRGFRGTQGTAHTAGEVVRDNPRFPKSAVQRALADTLQAVFPRLWATKAVTIEVTTAIGYGLPADCERVLRVEQEDLAGVGYWSPVKAWGFDNYPDTTAFPTGRAIRLDVAPGRSVRIVYAGRPTQPTDGQAFTVSGLPASSEDVVMYGACARLMSSSAAGQQSGIAAEAQLIDARQITAGGLQVARYFMALHQARLEEEAAALLSTTQVRAHRRI